MSKKIVITGGAGFIGSHLADALVSAGHEVHVIDNLACGKKENVPTQAVFHQLDILNTEAITPIVQKADVVFHLAALARVPFSFEHPAESHQANIDGTFSVLMASREGGVGRIVYAASSSAYGDQPTLPLSEDMRPNPQSPYAFQKLTGEGYLRLFSTVFGLPTVSLRFFNVYGSRMEAEGPFALAIPRFIEQRKKEVPLTITGDGTQTCDFTHIRDVVVAFMQAMEAPSVGKGEVINIAAGRNVSLNTLADLIGGERIYIPARATDPKDTFGDIKLAKELLGWEPTITLEEGIAELKRERNIP